MGLYGSWLLAIWLLAVRVGTQQAESLLVSTETSGTHLQHHTRQKALQTRCRISTIANALLIVQTGPRRGTNTQQRSQLVSQQLGVPLGAAQVLEYLCRYAHRTAIGNERIRAVTSEDLAFTVRAVTKARWQTPALVGRDEVHQSLHAASAAQRLQTHSPLRGAGICVQRQEA